MHRQWKPAWVPCGRYWAPPLQRHAGRWERATGKQYEQDLRNRNEFLLWIQRQEATHELR